MSQGIVNGSITGGQISGFWPAGSIYRSPHKMSAIAGTTSERKSSAGNSGLLVLLVVSAFINYLDRANLSIAAPMLKSDLDLSATQLGMLLSAFFWTYSTFQIVLGWLVDRFDVNRVMAFGFLLWSAATAGIGFAGSLATLLLMRLLLGMGESVAYPSYSKILSRYLPEERAVLRMCLSPLESPAGLRFAMFAGGCL